MQLSEQEVVRREKLTKLRELGINPYPADLFQLNSNSKVLVFGCEGSTDKEMYQKLLNEGLKKI